MKQPSLSVVRADILGKAQQAQAHLAAAIREIESAQLELRDLRVRALVLDPTLRLSWYCRLWRWIRRTWRRMTQ